jgi:hypothetical protein
VFTFLSVILDIGVPRLSPEHRALKEVAAADHVYSFVFGDGYMPPDGSSETIGARVLTGAVSELVQLERRTKAPHRVNPRKAAMASISTSWS